MPEEQRREIWDDGLHFTERGYDLMGRIIAERLSALISEIKGVKVMMEKPLKSDLKI
jgi:lysophospholipase L1-like esterase